MKHILSIILCASTVVMLAACHTTTRPSAPNPDTAHLLESGHSPGSAVPPDDLAGE